MDKLIVLDLEPIPKELAFLLDIINEDFPVMEKDYTEQVNEMNWSLFLDLVLHHRLYPVLYPRLKSYESFIPTQVLRQCKLLYQQNTLKMMQLTAEMDYVHNLLTNKEIPMLFLKGPMLATELYGDLSKRTSSDVDFLIPIEKLDEVETLLVGSGYEKDNYIQTVLNDWTWRHHHVTYVHPIKGTKLEVHWRLHPGPGKEPNFHQLWNQRSQCTITSSTINYLGKEDLFIFLTLHGARHGWSRLRWLLDIHQLLQQQLDWSKIIKLSNTFYCRSVVGQALVLSTSLFKSIIDEKLEPLQVHKKSKTLANKAVFYLKQMVNLHTNPVPEEVSRYHSNHLFSLMSLHQKILFILSFLYPYPEDAKTLPLPKQFHFLYFPLRPFLWWWRKTRKHALS